MSDLAVLLGQGGAVVSILIGLSVIALTVILVKGWEYLRLRNLPEAAYQSALTGALRGQFPAELQGSRDPVAGLLRHMAGLPVGIREESDRLRAESRRWAQQALGQLTGHLRILEVVANIAPLLGLFGTVLGMIEAFRAMEAAGSQVDPAVLSGGIWVALLTTAVGLAVAIPVSMTHSWFERRAEVQAHRLQDAIEQLITQQLSQPVAAQLASSRAA
ncbi:MotA/TolQ/ExbB proton channel family protein [Ketobacter sp.]|uniref:MotA/TolQ/ExbB proton channel family protein n=1 Tax=Ketobacter sp. TaxID=2083498 RepID=UPI000F2DABB5|nr:MotA/TolQ/ExbB proton channel family protein [Ketobacter sp.]RLU00623.1 MAG: MotA/TolQ/ExbB proton channel family protein [Ketobacter sp.]